MASAPGSPHLAPGDVHPVFDQVPAGALDDSGGDWPSALEGGRIVQVGLLAGQVLRAGADVLALGG